MKERKYKEDYKLITRIDPDTGREKRVAEYVGKYYRIPMEAAALKRFMLACIGLFALSFLTLAVYIMLNSPSSYCMYVMPIAAIALFPLLYWGMGLYSMWRAPEKMTSVQKETGVGRVLRSALGCMIFPALACIGDIVFLCLGGDFAGEWLALLMMAASAVSAGMCFVQARRVFNSIEVLTAEGGSPA